MNENFTYLRTISAKKVIKKINDVNQAQVYSVGRQWAVLGMSIIGCNAEKSQIDAAKELFSRSVEKEIVCHVYYNRDKESQKRLCKLWIDKTYREFNGVLKSTGKLR